MNTDLDKLAFRLHELFAVGGRIHLVQQPDSQYCAIRRRLSVGRIRKMLESQESIAAFQFCGGVTRWICLDFDLHRDHVINMGPELDLSAVLDVTRRCSNRLRHLGLKHLVEYSGNRGFHIWILLSQKLTRSDAYRILHGIVERCNIEGDLHPVKIDRYPASAHSRSTRGRGVKIPLSKHVKSQCYSYIVRDIDAFILDANVHTRELTPSFVQGQLELLNADIVCDKHEAFNVLAFDPGDHVPGTLHPMYVRASLHSVGNPTLDDLLRSLRRCKCVDALLYDIERGSKPDEDARVVLVGMLGRLASTDRPTLGLDLLHDFFATIPDYDQAKTDDKLRDLARLCPPTCEQLRNRLPQFSFACGPECKEHTSPIYYLSELGIDVVGTDPFALAVTQPHAVRQAQKCYTRENDEIALYWTQRELEKVSDIELNELCRPADLDRLQPLRYCEFERIETGNSTRRLVALSARDKIWTTAATLILNDLVYRGFSRNSYGYRIVPHFIGGRIFQHWLSQWKAFTGHLGELIYAPEYANWGLIKIDIKSFYDTIDLERLRLKLYDGPTPSLRRYYRTIDSTARGKYRRLVDQLIGACQLTATDGHGVPQGPAFARFLAEVYLMDLDVIVESQPQVAPDHYARYVDDLFVIIPESADIDAIEADVLHHIGTLGLATNPDKHFSGRVIDFRTVFAEYWQDTKYFIDQVSRHYSSASPDEVRRAARQMYSLVNAGDVAELNIEHLNFLYTHLEGDPPMDGLRARIEEYVLGLREGRGSLFNNFFRHYLNSWCKKDYEFDPRLTAIGGLRKECFLNLLLRRLCESPVEEEGALRRIRRVVDALATTNGSQLEAELGAALRLHDVRVAGPNATTTIDPTQLVCIAASNYPKSIPHDVEETIRFELLKLELGPFIDALSGIVFNDSRLRPEFLGTLLGDFRNKAMDAIREAEATESRLDFLLPSARNAVEERRDRYYQLCCLSSVSSPSPPDPNAVLDMIWGHFVSACNAFEHAPLVTSRWITKLQAVALDDTQVNGVLTRGIGDVVQGQRDNYGIFREFHQQLAIDQMGIADEGELGGQRHVQRDVGDNVRAAVRQWPDRWPLLSWVFTKSPRPSYAPRREECLANIATNGITVLRSGDEVLVRSPQDCLPAQPFDYLLEYSWRVDQLQGGRFKSETFRIARDGYVTVDWLLTRNEGLIGFIGAALELRQGAVRFAEKYRPVGSKYMPNVFATDARVREDDCWPEVPQLLLGPKLVTARKAGYDQHDNSVDSFDKVLYRKILESQQRLLGDNDHPAQIPANELGTRLLAPFDTASDKLEFLAAFCDQWKIMSFPNLPNAFQAELCKAAALRHLMGTAAPQSHAPSEIFLSRYFSLRREARRHFEYQLLLSPVDEPDCSTIAGVYDTVKKSITLFCESVEVPDFARDIGELLDADLDRLDVKLRGVAVDDSNAPRAADFARGVFTIDQYRGGLLLDDEQIQSQDPGEDEMAQNVVLDLTYLDRDFQRMDVTCHQMLENAGARVYQTRYYNKRLVVVLPRAVCKAADVISERVKEYRKIVADAPKEQIRQWCYVNPLRKVQRLQGLQEFGRAVQVVAANHPEMVEQDAQQHLEKWLLHMPEDNWDLLTRVIAAHEAIEKYHEDEFVRRLEALSESNEAIVLSLTTADDVGGWHRLLTRTNERLARQLFDRATHVEREVAGSLQHSARRDIAIITDIVVSGGQILKGLKEYYFATEANRVDSNRRHYFQIADFDRFQRGIRESRRVRIITARYSEDGERRLTSPDGLPALLGMPASSICCEGDRIHMGRCFLCGPGLESERQAEFKELIRNMAFVRRTFRFDRREHESFYESSVSNEQCGDKCRIDSTNLVVRRGSATKHSARIFRMTLQSGYDPLFRYVGELNE